MSFNVKSMPKEALIALSQFSKNELIREIQGFESRQDKGEFAYVRIDDNYNPTYVESLESRLSRLEQAAAMEGK